MTVVVTGVAGFIGSHLAARLLALGEDVVGIDCMTDYYDASLKNANLQRLVGDRRFRFERSDLTHTELRPLLIDASCVYHLAAQPGVRGSWGDAFRTYVQNNIVATQRLLEAMVGTSARIVFASSSSVYGDAETYPTPEDASPRPTSPYGVTKLCSEQLVMAYRRSAGIDARCVRYFTVYGPHQRPDMAFSRFIAAARKGDVVEVYGDGEQVRDFTFVSDAVEATIRAGAISDPDGAIFNVGGGSRVTVREVLLMIAEIVGRRIETCNLPAQPGDVRETGADLGRAATTLGWQPTVSLQDGLRQQVEAAQAGRG